MQIELVRSYKLLAHGCEFFFLHFFFFSVPCIYAIKKLAQEKVNVVSSECAWNIYILWVQLCPKLKYIAPNIYIVRLRDDTIYFERISK